MVATDYDLFSAGFTVNKWIGECFSALGDVYTARHNDASKVVIKTLPVDNVMDISYAMEEVRHLKALRHELILPLHSCFVHQQDIIIATPACLYGSALDIILNFYNNGLPEKAISALVTQLLRAVNYIHSKKIVHRSIRASHLLIDETGNLKLTGFRNALTIPDGIKCKITDFEREIEGSLLWLSPEVLAQDLNGYDTKSDIYSIGITLCELANGFPPFTDMEPLQMLYEKGRGTTPKLLDAHTLPALDTSLHAQREFSESFHNFTELSLKANQFHRPDCETLLHHPFARKSKKSVLHYMPLAKPLEETERIPRKDSEDTISESAPGWNF